MSGETDKEQQTEAPTQKKLDDARKKGQVASSPETKHGAIFASAMFAIGLLGFSAAQMKVLFVSILGGANDFDVGNSSGARSVVWHLFGQLLYAIGPVFGLFIMAAIVGGLLQGRPTISWSRVAPKFSKLNPGSNLKRILGPAEFMKTIAKFSVVMIAAIFVLYPSMYALEKALILSPAELVELAKTLLWQLLLTITVIVCIIALADNVYQRVSFFRRMRMSQQQVKDEYKDNEGDPHLKSRMRAIQRDRSRTRMLAEVVTATVVVTNPTHYAVALRYDHGKGNAPTVVARGVDEMAARIREAAKANGVPLYAKPALARALFAGVKLGQEVPEEHFVAVAEIISYVMKLKSQRAWS